MEERSIDRLSRYIIFAGLFTIVAALCWYFRSVLVYIIAAFVVSLIGAPIAKLLRRIRIKGRSAPDWLLSVLTLILIFLILGLVITRAVPVVTGIIRDASLLNMSGAGDGQVLDRLNNYLIDLFPALGPEFNGVDFIMEKLSGVLSLSSVSSVIGSVASAVTSLVIGIFSIVFISFFFIRDDSLFRRIVVSLVPDRLETRVGSAVGEIEGLLSRYFVGLIIEIIGVALLDFLGLWLIARVGVNYAIGIAFIAGILNVIPYVGPLLGEIIGVVLCLIIKYGTGAGLDVNIWLFALIVFVIMLAVQMVDVFVYQPLIYSTSIKAKPLEIFIVLLVAGHIGGAVGMFVAIPAYTVIRVIASRFFYHWKPVHRLIPDRETLGDSDEEETEMGRS